MRYINPVKKAGTIVGLLVLVLGVRHFLDDGTIIADYPRAGENIIAFGDSLTVGYGASQGSDYVSVLSNRIGQRIINAGRNGDTTESGMSRLQEAVLSQNPRIVLLLLGGNDARKKVPAEETFGRLGAMIDEIHKTGAAVILIGVRGSLIGDKYASGFRTLAEEKQVNFVPDILSGIFGHPSLMSDPIHPNDEGNLQMANRVEPVLRALLE